MCVCESKQSRVLGTLAFSQRQIHDFASPIVCTLGSGNQLGVYRYYFSPCSPRVSSKQQTQKKVNACSVQFIHHNALRKSPSAKGCSSSSGFLLAPFFFLLFFFFFSNVVPRTGAAEAAAPLPTAPLLPFPALLPLLPPPLLLAAWMGLRCAALLPLLLLLLSPLLLLLSLLLFFFPLARFDRSGCRAGFGMRR